MLLRAGESFYQVRTSFDIHLSAPFPLLNCTQTFAALKIIDKSFQVTKMELAELMKYTVLAKQSS